VKKIGKGFLIALVVWTVLVGLFWFIFRNQEGGETGIAVFASLVLWTFGVIFGVVVLGVVAVIWMLVRVVRGPAAPDSPRDEPPPA
jgi:hypothetical protein